MARFSRKEYDQLQVHNVRNQAAGPLRDWWCEKCGRKLHYPADAPTPQCPYCYSSQGLVVPMRRYTFIDFSQIGGSNVKAD